MKRYLLTLILCFAGITVFAQGSEMSFLTTEFMRSDASFADKLSVLERVQTSGQTGIGEFYHEALKYLHLRITSARALQERIAAERSAIILCQGLAAEKYTAAAPDLWQAVQVFDVSRSGSSYEGLAMQAAFIALAQIDAREYIPHIVLRLDSFNSRTISGDDQRRRAQRAVIGCINALEIFKDPSGFRPVFLASIGSYDPSIREIASNALLNIISDPADVVAEILLSPANNPTIKLEVLREMLQFDVPNASKAKVAAAALATGWLTSTSSRPQQVTLGNLRKTAIDAIRHYGAADDSVYLNLDRSYSRNFATSSPDYDEIQLTLNALAALKTDEAAQLLHKYLQELHLRRRSGPWGNKERQVFEWLVYSIGASGSRSTDIRFLLTTVSHADHYTWIERNMASEALRRLGY
ncbi:MAG: hypothetical protein FWD14_02780 [Treponema sp.]|nr:hypothetical protein [Treponema sp.]